MNANALAIHYFFTKDEESRALLLNALEDRIKRTSSNYYRRCIGQLDEEDLFACGQLGALKALDRYTPDRGDYEPYAMKYVQGEMLHLIRDSSLTIKVPGSVKEAGWRIRKYTEDIQNREDRTPDSSEIATALNLSIERTEHCININARQKTTECLEDAEEAAADIYGKPLDRNDSGNISAAQEIYNKIVKLYLDGMSAIEIGREMEIGRNKAETLVRFIKVQLG